jgi:hypothetical protein
MTTLGNQLIALLNRKMPDAFERGGDAMAKMIADQMEENTERGRAFGSDPYNNKYSKRSVNEREQLGLQTGTVVLRRGNHRIETTRVTKIKGQGAFIDFAEGGRIFKEHHIGQPILFNMGRNVPMRSIFPKSYASVPDDILHDTKLVIAEALSGNY